MGGLAVLGRHGAAVSIAALASRVSPQAETEYVARVAATAHQITDKPAVVAG